MKTTASGQISEETKKEMIDLLTQALLDGMFGDGQEKEYVLNGFPDFKGLENLTDKELLDKFIEIYVDDYEEHECEEEKKIADKAKKEMGL